MSELRCPQTSAEETGCPSFDVQGRLDGTVSMSRGACRKITLLWRKQGEEETTGTVYARRNKFGFKL